MSAVEECLICGAPITYLASAEPMTCSLCGARMESDARCERGHFVCDECHASKGREQIVAACIDETSSDPVEILDRLMDLPACHMHGPEHHVMVAAALLTAYRNAGGELDLQSALAEAARRGSGVPGGACGFWGACGAAISAGIFVSIATGSTPLSNEGRGAANRATSRVLAAIAESGGPRCCKRESFKAAIEASAFASEELGVEMRASRPLCRRSHMNEQCIGARCPFSHTKGHTKGASA